MRPSKAERLEVYQESSLSVATSIPGHTLTSYAFLLVLPYPLPQFTAPLDNLHPYLPDDLLRRLSGETVCEQVIYRLSFFLFLRFRFSREWYEPYQTRPWMLFCIALRGRPAASRISPMDGPPKHRRISDEDPPSSETGRTKAGEAPKALAMELAPVPPEMIRYNNAPRCDPEVAGEVPDARAGDCRASDATIGESTKTGESRASRVDLRLAVSSGFIRKCGV